MKELKFGPPLLITNMKNILNGLKLKGVLSIQTIKQD